MTGIYYLLSGSDCSLLHRIQSDEMWHFYLGDPLTIVEIVPESESSYTLNQTSLGPPGLENQMPQYTVKKGHWFGAFLENKSGFCLVGCTVAPGFDFEDFEMVSPEMTFSGLEDNPFVRNLLPS